MLIKNASELTSKGNAGGRKVILKIVEETLEKVNYFIILKELVHLEKNILKIRDFELNLDKFRNIYLIGGGKNSSFMTSAIDEILRDRLTEGIVIEKKGCLNKKTKIAYSTGGHPLPDLDSVKSAHKIAKMVQKAKQEDLIIVCVSGGWTALTSNPEEGITLKELQKTYGLLLKSGMTVEQMNVVRNRLIQLGKGKILSMADGATIVGLIAVDEVEGKPWGPTVFDSSAPSDGIKILQDFNLFEKIPLSVKEYLVKEELKKKTTRETGFQHNGRSPYNFVIADNSLLCKAAQDTASKFGIKSFLLSTSIRGEAKDVGRVIASISKEISRFRRPFEPPCIIVAGGETTVTIVGKSGKGGRNQEMALSAAQDIEGLSNIVIASVATDGIDGPTGIAGAIVDGTTMKNVEEKGLSIVRELSCHNSSYVLEKISDAIYTFDTATNLMDLILVYIS